MHLVFSGIKVGLLKSWRVGVVARVKVRVRAKVKVKVKVRVKARVKVMALNHKHSYFTCVPYFSFSHTYKNSVGSESDVPGPHGQGVRIRTRSTIRVSGRVRVSPY